MKYTTWIKFGKWVMVYWIVVALVAALLHEIYIEMLAIGWSIVIAVLIGKREEKQWNTKSQ